VNRKYIRFVFGQLVNMVHCDGLRSVFIIIIIIIIITTIEALRAAHTVAVVNAVRNGIPQWLIRAIMTYR